MRVLLLKADDIELCEIAAKLCTTDSDINNIVNSISSSDLSLFHRVMSYGHTSISEHVGFTFGIEGISRACSHQLVRNRIASYSQRSQRYIKEFGFLFITPKTIKDSRFHEKYLCLMNDINLLYEEMIASGIPAEDARFILPNSAETKLIMTLNIRSLINFCNERLCTKAQWEIRDLAKAIKKEVLKTSPVLEPFLVPKCRAIGYCIDKNSCGLMPSKQKFFKEE